MGDPFQRVTAGSPVPFSARRHNALSTIAIEWPRQKELGGGRPESPRMLGSDVPIANGTGDDLARFAVVGLDTIVISPTDNADEFKNNPAFDAATPDEDLHQGKIAILQEPIADGKIGLGRVAGISVVQIDVTDATHGYAKLTDGDATKLTSHASEGHRILYAEAGTGTKWGVVSLGFFSSQPWIDSDLSVYVEDGSPAVACAAGIFYGASYAYSAECRSYFHFPEPLVMDDIDTLIVRAPGVANGIVAQRLYALLSSVQNIDVDDLVRLAFVTADFDASMTWGTQPATLAVHTGGYGRADRAATHSFYKNLRRDHGGLLAYCAPSIPGVSTLVYGVQLSVVLTRYGPATSYFTSCYGIVNQTLANLACRFVRRVA